MKKAMLRRINNIVMVMLSTLKRVRLPNERAFLAKYERKKSDLPGKATVKEKYKNQARKSRQGSWGM